MRTSDGTLHTDKLGSTASSPGYRHFSFSVLLNYGQKRQEVELHFNMEDTSALLRAIWEVHAVAWRGGVPIDVKPGERQPAFLNAPPVL